MTDEIQKLNHTNSNDSKVSKGYNKHKPWRRLWWGHPPRSSFWDFPLGLWQRGRSDVVASGRRKQNVSCPRSIPRWFPANKKKITHQLTHIIYTCTITYDCMEHSSIKNITNLCILGIWCMNPKSLFGKLLLTCKME